MSLGINLPFDNEDNYTFDSDDIEISGGNAALKLKDNPGQDFNQPFDSDTGFTYDSDKSEFTGGKVQQKDQRPTDATCYATYTTDINLNAGGGVLTGTASGGAMASGGYLDLKTGGVKYVDYAGLNNADNLIQTGCIRFILKPNYSGSPAAIRNFIVISEASEDASNLVNIYHKSSDGNIKVVMNNQTTGTIMTEDLGVWNPTAGTDYEFELNFAIDTVGGGTTAIRLFIDGTQFGATKTGVIGTRSSAIGLIRVGTNVGTGDTSNHSIKDLILFSEVQHTTNYTKGYTLPEADYLGDVVTLPDFIYSGGGLLQAFTNIVSTETNSPRWIINDLYYSGGWTASSGTWATASPIADILANMATLPTANTVTIELVTNNGSVQMDAADLTLTYAGQIYATDNPTIEPNTAISADQLITFVETVNKSGSDDIKYTIKVDGVQKYWNGSVVVNSSGYSQTNTAAEIQANGSEFTGTLIPVIHLHSEDGTTTPSIGNLAYTYDYNPPEIDVTVVNVYGYIYKSDGIPDTGAKVKITVPTLTEGAATNINVPYQFIEIETDEDGGWETDLILSSLLGDVEYELTVIPTDGKKQKQSKPVRDIHGTGQVEWGEL